MSLTLREMILFLRVNRRFWSKSTVAKLSSMDVEEYIPLAPMDDDALKVFYDIGK
jgi:hypothetical protein